MNEQDEFYFGAKKFCVRFSRFLNVEMGLLKAATGFELSERAEEIKAVILAICQTAWCITKLSESDMLNECKMLGRALLERSVNFVYLLVCDEKEFRRYRNYTIQKAHRRLERSVTAGKHTISMKYEGVADPSEVPGLKKALDMFTSKRGREITRWTQNGLGERIEVIDEKSSVSALPFLMCWHSIYEDASEALHGTFYGCTFHTSAYEPNVEHSDEAKLNENLRKNLTLLNWECGILLNSLLHAANYEGRLDDLCDISSENTEQTFRGYERASERNLGRRKGRRHVNARLRLLTLRCLRSITFWFVFMHPLCVPA